MDKLTHYKKTIKKLLQRYTKSRSISPDVKLETIFDDKQKHYQLIAIGWENKKRIHRCLIHIDIQNNKIWVQQNNTDAKIAEFLIENGILAKQIVLGFLPKYMRKYSNFALN